PRVGRTKPEAQARSPYTSAERHGCPAIPVASLALRASLPPDDGFRHVIGAFPSPALCWHARKEQAGAAPGCAQVTGDWRPTAPDTNQVVRDPEKSHGQGGA